MRNTLTPQTFRTLSFILGMAFGLRLLVLDWTSPYLPPLLGFILILLGLPLSTYLDVRGIKKKKKGK